MNTQPEDLITIKEASKMAGKSQSSIRSWIRSKKISGYKRDPKNRNSSLLVSEEELRIYLATNGKITSSEVGRKPDISRSLQSMDTEIKSLKEKIVILENNLVVANQLISAKDELVANLQNQILDCKDRDSRNILEIERLSVLISESHQKYISLSTEYRQMSAYYQLPIWKRWGRTPPLLTDGSKDS